MPTRDPGRRTYRRGLPWWGAACALSALLASQAAPAQTSTAHSLDQVPGLLKSPEAKSFFDQQIVGTPAPDLLGLHLPPALSAQTVVALLLPAGHKAKLNAVGAKPLPGQPDRYVAVVCTGGDIPTSADDPRCSQSDGDAAPLRVTLGIIEAKAGAPARLVARPVTTGGMVDWGHTTLPSGPDSAPITTGDAMAPGSIGGFDLAPYRITPDQTAIGLRGAWSASYSGGGAEWTALYLFAVTDGALREVLAVPMSSYQDIAPDWHKDGTRDHDITDVANILIVTAHAVDGHFDLLLKQRGGHAETRYRWSAAAGHYQRVTQR